LLENHWAIWPSVTPRRSTKQHPCCGCIGCPRGRIRPTYEQACRLLWLVCVKGWTQTHAANEVGVSSGTASRIVRGLRFPDAQPVPIPIRRRESPTSHRQAELPF